MTNFTQLAIERAFEGGYKYSSDSTFFTNSGKFLDPQFWRCLGKSEGWKRLNYHQTIPAMKIRGGTHHAHIRAMTKPTPNRWKKEWHRFIDHLAADKDVESFFQGLLGKE